MNMKLQTLDAPDYWAPALINGDYSGLTEEESQHVHIWFIRNNVGSVLSCADEPRFTNSYALYYPESGATSGSVLEFTCTDTSEEN